MFKILVNRSSPEPVAAVQDEKTEDPQKTVEKQDAPSNEPAAKETSVPKQGGKKGERKVTTAERGHCRCLRPGRLRFVTM